MADQENTALKKAKQKLKLKKSELFSVACKFLYIKKFDMKMKISK